MSARKNRTIEKSAVEEDLPRSPKKIKKNEPFEQLKSTESLKIEKPQSEPKAKQQKTKYIKTALKGVNNGTPKDTKAKEQAQAEKSNK